MFVAVSCRCFPDLPLDRGLEKLADLEYTAAELVIGHQPCDLRPDSLVEDMIGSARRCVSCRQIVPVAIYFDLSPDEPNFFEHFDRCSKLAHLLKIVGITVNSAPLGTPYNEEIERLRHLVRIGIKNGIIVSVITKSGCITDSIDSIRSLCRSVPELAITLDPSWFIWQRGKPVDFENIVEYVSHVRLRDTTFDHFQVQLGQGVLEYGKLVTQLQRVGYSRALCVDLAPLPGINQESELRKMRLLMESII